MKIIIDTHDKPDEDVDTLVAYLRENSWDNRVNNAEDQPAPLHPDPNEGAECQHTFMNGECTKCHWLQI